MGLTQRFDAIIGGDTMGPGKSKPHAAPIEEMIQRCGGGRTVFLGDSINDTMAAKNAGIPSIAVSFGFLMQPIEELMADLRSEEHTSEIQSLMRISYAVFSLKKTTK